MFALEGREFAPMFARNDSEYAAYVLWHRLLIRLCLHLPYSNVLVFCSLYIQSGETLR